MNEPLWKPNSELIENATITKFARYAGELWGAELNSFDTLHKWSTDCSEEFWKTIWKFCEVRSSNISSATVRNREQMPGAVWFPDAQLSFTENLLRRNDDGAAIISRGEAKADRIISYAELNQEVNRLARAYRALGIEPGDRIVAYMPNIPETVICMLAAASCGAVWSSCSPDFGARGVIDRFGQVEPKVIISVDGYTYNGKKFDISEKLTEILKSLPTVEKFLIVPYLDEPTSHELPNAVTLSEFVDGHSSEPIDYLQLPFNHPLFILFSSGTTGAPKCIVHGVGGTLLQHLKEHRLHVNLKKGMIACSSLRHAAG